MLKKLILACLIMMIGALALNAQSYGDLDNNGKINIQDAILVARYYTGMDRNIDIRIADVNGDKKVNVEDAIFIGMHYVGIIDFFPVDNMKIALPVSPGEKMEKEKISQLNKEENPNITDEDLKKVANGINHFAYKLYNQVKDEPENVFFSPLSISYAFAMCSAGAENNTKAEIINTLSFPYNNETLHKAYNAIYSSLTTPSKKVEGHSKNDLTLDIANSIWGQKDYHFEMPFLDTLALNYGAKMNLMDFKKSPEESRLIINKWVADNTSDMIKELLKKGSILSTTRLMLVNALFFKAIWQNNFFEMNTKDEEFTSLDGSKNTIAMMHGAEVAQYYDGGNYQMMIKNYKGQKQQNAMYIILPKDGEFQNVEKSLNTGLIEEAVTNTTKHYVQLSLPKFKTSWGKDLIPILKNLGMKEPFSSKADFSGMTGDKSLFIGLVVHEAAIEVDEKGTKASAATAIGMMEKSMKRPKEPRVTMNVNRPFIYVIRNMNTGAILFMGKIINLKK